MSTHPLLVKAAQHTAQARAINDEFEGKSMPAEAAREMDEHLAKAAELRQRVTREAALVENEQWINEPQYAHDMTNGVKIAEQFGHGRPLVDEQQKDYAKKAFLQYLRGGKESLSMEQRSALATKAAPAGDLVEEPSGTGSAGATIVPRDFAGTILTDLPRLGTIRNLAYVRPTTKQTVDVGNLMIDTAGWGKLELQVVTPQAGLASPAAAVQTITVHNLNALIRLGRDELEDSDENLEEVLRNALSLKFAEVEDDAYANGDGTAKPWGLASTHNTNVKNFNAATAGVVTPDELKKLTFAVSTQFRRGGSTNQTTGSRAVFLWNAEAEQAVALLKDNEGRYLMQNQPSQSEPGRFMGYEWYTVDGLPAFSGTNAKSILFGDIYSAYMICDRRQLTVQRLVERYAELGLVGLLFTMRVGGDIIRPNAVASIGL